MSNAPRITPDDIQANIAHVFYFTPHQGVVRALMHDPALHMTFEQAIDSVPESLKLMTICVIMTKSGFIVTGESACVSPENFNEELGRQLSYKQAESKLWGFMGYNLRETLYQQASGRSSDRAERSEAKVENGEHDAVGTGEGETFLVEHLDAVAEEASHPHPFGEPTNKNTTEQEEG